MTVLLICILLSIVAPAFSSNTPSANINPPGGVPEGVPVPPPPKKRDTCANTPIQCSTSPGVSSSCATLGLNSDSTCTASSSVNVAANTAFTCCQLSGCNVPITGTPIGTAGSYQNNGNTIAKAFDSDTTTFFDGPSSSAWVGLNLGSPNVVSSVGFVARSGTGNAARLTNAVFQVSSTIDFSSDVTTVGTIASTPSSNPTVTYLSLEVVGNKQYVRLYGATEGNVAELYFYGCPQSCNQTLTGTVTGTPGGYGAGTNTFDKAHDGDKTTFYDAANTWGSWSGLDFGSQYKVSGISFFPRVGSWSGYPARMVGAKIQVSNSPDWSGDVYTVGTITATPSTSVYTWMSLNTNVGPGAFRYARVFNASQGNVAEFNFFGCPTAVCESWNQASAVAYSDVTVASSSCFHTFTTINTVQQSSTSSGGGDITGLPTLAGNFPAGNYQVTYVTGCFEWSGGGSDWGVAALSGYNWQLQDTNGNQITTCPSVYGMWADQATCQSNQAGVQPTTFAWTGGNIFLKLLDTGYGNNLPGSPNPTFSISSSSLQYTGKVVS